MKIKQRPEDFSVVESWRFEPARHGEHYVYRMDKQKVSTLAAVERLCERFRLKRRDVSFCGLKDKQGRTEQLIAVRGKPVELQEADLRLTFLGRSSEPLSAKNITSNRFSVIVRDLSEEDAARVPESVAEVSRVGVVNYFDSQRFGFVKHGQGFVARDLLRGDLEAALQALIATPSELDRTEDAKVKAWLREHWGEWEKRPPQESWVKYRAVLARLRERPRDFGYALMAMDARMRAMVVYELQSALWNDAVVRWLRAKIPDRDLVHVRYQLGALAFPRALPPELARSLRDKTFPLLAPETTFDDPEVKKACEDALARQKLSLARLKVPNLDAFHFKHELRPLFVFPGRLHAGEPHDDDENRGRLKLTLSFTLPPGAYATLVVRRVFWHALSENQPDEQAEPHKGTRGKPRTAPAAPKAPPPPPAEPRKGFLERQKEKKAAREAARRAAQEAAGKQGRRRR